jgi:hypothetical protein
MLLMTQTQELASERARSALELAERLRPSRRLRMLRRARRIERRAERRMLEAWRRAEELRGALDLADY